MIDGKTFFDQPSRIDHITYENIPQNTADEGYDYTVGFPLDYVSF